MFSSVSGLEQSPVQSSSFSSCSLRVVARMEGGSRKPGKAHWRHRRAGRAARLVVVGGREGALDARTEAEGAVVGGGCLCSALVVEVAVGLLHG